MNRTTLADPARVQQMFGAIARRYDLANHVLSCGFDFYWRKRAVDIVSSWRAADILDLATGTGDLALAMQKRLTNARIVAADFSREMLEIAATKGVQRTLLADATALPFSDGSFDAVTIAFGLRNVADWSQALREIHRVLRLNGHVLVLDFSLPALSVLRTPYRFYLHRVAPLIGHLLTGKKDAYDYLGESIEQFPSGDPMCRLLEQNGFGNVTAEPLTGGIVTIYTGQR